MKHRSFLSARSLSCLILIWLCHLPDLSGADFAFVDLGGVRDGNYCLGLTIKGNYAYVGYDNGLSIYDISNKGIPPRVGSVNPGYFVSDVVVVGDYAYVAANNFLIDNVSDPVNPTNVATVALGIWISDVTVSGSFAYLITGRDGFRIYNISTPGNPFAVGHFDNHSITMDFTPYSGGIAVSGHYAYVANGNEGLRVFDISNPTNPISLYNRFDGGNALSIAISNNFAFLANNNDGIRVYDISNPLNVTNVGHVDGGYATKVWIADGYLYAANDIGGLHVYDIQDPVNIRDAGSVPAGVAQDVALSGTRAYVADRYFGLHLFQLYPQLKLNLIDPSLAVLSWPAIPITTSLYETSDFPTTNWLTVTNAISLSGNRKQVTLPVTSSSHYYRLTATQ